MNKAVVLTYEFVQAIPEKLEERTIYVAMDYATAVHKCCCGCGKEVVTPLSPTDWKLTYDGESISLSPSIGNWSFECQSHYFIVQNTVKWVDQWSKERIETGRTHDQKTKQTYFGTDKTIDSKKKTNGKSSDGFLSRFVRWWSR